MPITRTYPPVVQLLSTLRLHRYQRVARYQAMRRHRVPSKPKARSIGSETCCASQFIQHLPTGLIGVAPAIPVPQRATSEPEKPANEHDLNEQLLSQLLAIVPDAAFPSLIETCGRGKKSLEWRKWADGFIDALGKTASEQKHELDERNQLLLDIYSNVDWSKADAEQLGHLVKNLPKNAVGQQKLPDRVEELEVETEWIIKMRRLTAAIHKRLLAHDHGSSSMPRRSRWSISWRSTVLFLAQTPFHAPGEGLAL